MRFFYWRMYNKGMKINEVGLEDLKRELKNQLPFLRKRYSVNSLGVFGSFVKGQQKSRSDVDLLVTFSETPGLFKFIEMENYLSDLLGKKVDLVMKDALKPEIGRRILNEVEQI
jgi:predicted nucleotidyltransferase